MKKRVLITGGNKGIGLECTRLFLENNYKVIVVARDYKNFEFNNNDDVDKIEYDVSNIKGIADLVNKIGCVDILVNNAGIMNSIPYDNYPVEKMNKIMDINLYAPIEFIKEVSKSMVEAGSGRIVNTASIAGQIGHPDIWYGVSKAGIINATKSFAKLLGSKGIIINAVAPGPVETEMMNVIPEQRKKDIKSSVYLDRFARAEEVAKTIYWLATDSPEYINGTCIDINNGAFPR
ncbi:SDR family NAD(P)-dependent oxidoreductase [Clostridium saccharobutylicum]|uniref:3-oxoacyl-[acyl-carrier-protein] reductase FabG n=1 Tax=Clostridium saccharobutylicum DSM 13864 TaxID=1345695 RepID=U5MY67_CLOSA|nr:SDR family oxidoreductase [Clostridium saccharobutylicum]AGX44387.1 3-oxoacyl-[acyl-carrier-protein] reductase FabG [Clostridium saccharobutylicum DSM 13864]AQR91680.1 3-oxoacyl-[acyl-carrier-protein] reductase FabG [Clostridium saccharobutylicum]AQS01584.1 3-oxoacyl-[acyl-carrier-protein] reductase FabG [Clostridium saccharobutylicum]AQS11194.1 3-oxoacyl-[acyl-carrier-protein] reductase FabG [Clostridium saccharobutylicum]AQS15567.1 3-oxoacyl-[acyl-carrier-protein] reductase FabG [Clostrid